MNQSYINLAQSHQVKYSAAYSTNRERMSKAEPRVLREVLW